MTGFKQRFEVSCAYCGMLDYFPKLSEAIKYSKSVYADHDFCGKDVMIYDRFAHIGKIELYNFNGTPRQNRSSK